MVVRMGRVRRWAVQWLGCWQGRHGHTGQHVCDGNNEKGKEEVVR